MARESADIVLSDDNYSTIVRAIAEGRRLFSNLTKGVRYYLACKMALVLITLVPVLFLVPIPFTPIQIILMELFMDLAASATFAAEPAEVNIMNAKPRNPKARFLDRTMVLSIFSSAAGLFVAVVIAYLITWYGSYDLARAQTVAFCSWLIGHTFLALNMRSEKEPLIRLGILSNRLMIAWMLATFAFVAIVTFLPAAQVAFKTTSLAPYYWLLIFVLTFAGTFWIEIAKWLRGNFRQRITLATTGDSVLP